MIKTAITEMFDIEHPIICGGMMWLCRPALCAAISNAGGMGNLTAGIYNNEEDFRKAIKETRTLTDKPFTVNITILPSVRITKDHYRMYARVCAEEEVAALEISGMPIDQACGAETVAMLKKAGVKLFQKVGSVRHAIHAERAGYDGIYAAGFEEGGHPLDDDVTTMVLTPRIKAKVSIPVVTVGGIGSGETMAAALMLGADAVMMASRFIATKECLAHDGIKEELIRRQENDTAMICKTLKLQGRALKNKTVKCVLDEEARGGGFEKIYPYISGERCVKAWETGDADLAPLFVGQSIGLIEDIPSCKDLLSRMTSQAETRIREWSGKIR